MRASKAAGSDVELVSAANSVSSDKEILIGKTPGRKFFNSARVVVRMKAKKEPSRGDDLDAYLGNSNLAAENIWMGNAFVDSFQLPS